MASLLRDNWRWREYLKMLNSSNSESCLSQLLLLVRPERFEISYNNYVEYDFYNLALFRYQHADEYEKAVRNLCLNFSESYQSKSFIFENTIYKLNQSLDAIESYLLSFLTTENDTQDISTLVSGTFGYFLSNEEEKQRMINLFLTIKKYLTEKITNSDKRAVFSRTLLGIDQLVEIEQWVTNNSMALINCETTTEILQILMPQLIKYSNNKSVKAIVATDELSRVASLWISGISYNQILEYAIENDIKIIRRKKKASVQLEDIIDICDEGFGYAATLIINAISDLLQFQNSESEDTCKLMSELSRQMRYGLPSRKSIIIYESGFSDRAISLRLSEKLKGFRIATKKQFKEIAHEQKEVLMDILSDYPQIFSDRMSEL